MFPQKTSVLTGAVENTITLGCSTAYPSGGVEVAYGFCKTPLILIINWAAAFIFAFLPLLKVALNLVLKPSNPKDKEWLDPELPVVRFIEVLLSASLYDAANLIESKSLLITKYIIFYLH